LAIVAGCWFACVALATVRAAEKLKAEPEFFEKLVRPVLADNCFQCHGPSEHKGELRLDSRAAMLQGGEMGPAIVPNNPEASLLITAVHYSDEPKMPPRGKLKPEQIEALGLARGASNRSSADCFERPEDHRQGPRVLVVPADRRSAGGAWNNLAQDVDRQLHSRQAGRRRAKARG
jgi:hypothetical protein